MVPAQAHPAVLQRGHTRRPRPALHEGPVVDAALPTAIKKGYRSDSESVMDEIVGEVVEEIVDKVVGEVVEEVVDEVAVTVKLSEVVDVLQSH